MAEGAREVTDSEFESAVIDRSTTLPVVVDLWAPWCGPCRQLAPLLEKIARERSGDFELVKVNVDENPATASRLGARSIPLVVGFRDGKPVAQFIGAQPESAINRFIDQILPSQTDRLVSAAREMIAAHDTTEAQSLLHQALELDRHHEQARVLLAELLQEEGRVDEAIHVLGKIAPNRHDEAAALLARLQLEKAGESDVDELERQLQENPQDLDTMVRLGQALAARKSYTEALDILLRAVQTDASWKDGAARQAMLDIFNVLGMSDPLTRQYRTRLSNALF